MENGIAKPYIVLRYQIVIHFTHIGVSKQTLLLNSEYKYPLQRTEDFTVNAVFQFSATYIKL